MDFTELYVALAAINQQQTGQINLIWPKSGKPTLDEVTGLNDAQRLALISLFNGD